MAAALCSAALVIVAAAGAAPRPVRARRARPRESARRTVAGALVRHRRARPRSVDARAVRRARLARRRTAVRRGGRRDRRHGRRRQRTSSAAAIDAVLMRITDAVLSMPRLLLLMVAAAILQPVDRRSWSCSSAWSAGWKPRASPARRFLASARARVRARRPRARRLVMAAGRRAHLLPIAAPAIAVSTTLAVGRGILLESTLSFFGVGVQPPAASWGNMLYQAQSTMTHRAVARVVSRRVHLRHRGGD